jgi:hypothetical protein
VALPQVGAEPLDPAGALPDVHPHPGPRRVLARQEDQDGLAEPERLAVLQLDDRQVLAGRHVPVPPREDPDVQVAARHPGQAPVQRPAVVGDLRLHGDVDLVEALQRPPHLRAAPLPSPAGWVLHRPLGDDEVERPYGGRVVHAAGPRLWGAADPPPKLPGACPPSKQSAPPGLAACLPPGRGPRLSGVGGGDRWRCGC